MANKTIDDLIQLDQHKKKKKNGFFSTLGKAYKGSMKVIKPATKFARKTFMEIGRMQFEQEKRIRRSMKKSRRRINKIRVK